MAEFNIQSDSVDVTRIMEQIRQRIREKRGTDYTEQQIRELATVKVERFLDPRHVRSDLVEHYRQLEPPAALEPISHKPAARAPGPAPEPVEFDSHTIYMSSRGPMGKLIRLIRKLLNPILRLFFNPDPVVLALARQGEINAWMLQILQQESDLAERVTKQFERAGAKFVAREELDALNFEVLNNLVVEMTRLSLDMKNHRMLVESVAGRLDFDERRARALESVVQRRSPVSPAVADGEVDESTSSTGSGRTRRRRRRSRRRPQTAETQGTGTDNAEAAGTVTQSEATESVPSPGTATPPGDTAAPAGAPSRSHGVPISAPAVEPSPADLQQTPSPPVPDSAPAPASVSAGEPAPAPVPSIQGPSDAPSPAAAPATERVPPTAPKRDVGPDEQ